MIYQTTIKGMGDQVEAFVGEGIFVTFGDNAPDTLTDFCYTVDVNPVQGDIKPGSKLVIDGQEYTITMVEAMTDQGVDMIETELNTGKSEAVFLANAFHVTYSFNGSGECLPGSICVEKADVPSLKVGSTISITE